MWADLAYCAQVTDEGPVADRNRAARFTVLWALQYDRRPQDLPLLRFLLQQQTTYYSEAVPSGMAPDLTLAGFLVAEHWQAEDLWLHWDAKNISFDTALGYHLYHLLTAGIAAATETVRASSTPTANASWATSHRPGIPMPPSRNGWTGNAHDSLPIRPTKDSSRGPTTPRASASARRPASS